jgi:tetratricopeptide (TPR) repeat protein
VPVRSNGKRNGRRRNVDKMDWKGRIVKKGGCMTIEDLQMQLLSAIQDNNFERICSVAKKYSEQVSPPPGFNYISSYFDEKTTINGKEFLITKTQDTLENKNQWYGSILYNIGNELARNGSFQLSIAVYTESLKNYPHPSALNNMAASYKYLKDYKSACDCYYNAIKIDKEYTQAYLKLSVLSEAYGYVYEKSSLDYFKIYMQRTGNNIIKSREYIDGFPKEEVEALERLISRLKE